MSENNTKNEHVYRLLLVRHGHTDWNKKMLFQGFSDIPLNETGLQQAECVGQHLAEHPIKAIVASDLSRAAQTAQAIAGHHEVEIAYNSNWRELNFGKFEGLTHTQIKEKYPTEWESWIADRENAPPGGEALSTVMKRIRQGIIELPKVDDYVAIVAHGGILQLLLCELLGISTSRRWTFKLRNTSVSELMLYPDGPIVEYLNATAHLPKELVT